MSLRILQSSLKAINELIHGYIPGLIYNFVGAKLSGKTLLTLQESCYMSSKYGGDIVLFDVDGGAELFVSEWEPVFRMRFGDFGKILVVPSFNRQILSPQLKHPKFQLTLLEHFGLKAKVEISENGKGEFIPYAVTTSLAEQLYEKGVRYFIVDSFSQLFKDSFPGTQSFGERARAEDTLFSLFKSFLAEHSDCILFVNHHVSINPIHGTIDISGGSAVIQNSKIALLLSKKPRDPVGKIIIYRWPRKPPFSEEKNIRFTDGGIFDDTE